MDRNEDHGIESKIMDHRANLVDRGANLGEQKLLILEDCFGSWMESGSILCHRSMQVWHLGLNPNLFDRNFHFAYMFLGRPDLASV